MNAIEVGCSAAESDSLSASRRRAVTGEVVMNAIEVASVAAEIDSLSANASRGAVTGNVLMNAIEVGLVAAEIDSLSASASQSSNREVVHPHAEFDTYDNCCSGFVIKSDHSLHETDSLPTRGDSGQAMIRERTRHLAASSVETPGKVMSEDRTRMWSALYPRLHNLVLYLFALMFVCLNCQACHDKPRAEAFCGHPTRSVSTNVRLTFDTENSALKCIGTKVATVHPLEFVIQATGELQPNANAVTRVNAAMNGKIDAVYASVGEYVKQGQVLATIKSVEIGNLVTDLFKTEIEIDSELSKDLLEIDCELKQLSAELKLCQRQHDRAQLLLDEKIGSQANLEACQTLLEKHQLSVAALEEKKERITQVAKDRFRLARVALVQRLSTLGMPEKTIRQVLDRRELVSSIPIEAPQSGFILERNVNPSELVDSARTLFVIDDIDTLWLVADVFEHDVQFIKHGEIIEFTVDSFPNHVFKGKIDFISEAMNPETRTLAVRALISNPGQKLKPKMFARMKICAGHHRTLAIEKTAIQDAGSDKVVYVPISHTEYEERKVVPGEENEKYVEVVKGLHDGEPVVVCGASLLRSQCLKQAR